jgi:hypothetical protein
MISIANPRAEKAARRLAKHLRTTISEAVAVACERLLHAQDYAASSRLGASLDRVLADIRGATSCGDAAERARLADHSDLYGPDGLPR